MANSLKDVTKTLLKGVDNDRAQTILENLVREVVESQVEKCVDKTDFLIQHMGSELVSRLEKEIAAPTEITVLRILAHATQTYHCNLSVVVEPDEIDTNDKMHQVAKETVNDFKNDRDAWQELDNGWQVENALATKVVTLKVGETWVERDSNDPVTITEFSKVDDDTLVFYYYDDGSEDSCEVSEFLDLFLDSSGFDPRSL